MKVERIQERLGLSVGVKGELGRAITRVERYQ